MRTRTQLRIAAGILYLAMLSLIIAQHLTFIDSSYSIIFYILGGLGAAYSIEVFWPLLF